MKKYIFISALFCAGFCACNGSGANAEKENNDAEAAGDGASSAALGEITYKTQCANCHGADGKLGVSGAKDLQLSTLSEQDAINVVSYGRGGMMAYKDFLTKDQIGNVVAYIETLRKK